ncbi:c-type cytochrome [Sinimarinibacterium thermocellulolyticum]|uniref:cytochrome-c oxidase n=1 Tax=Sinimarinibacterium thermocellulolyticum TaxID=3170016 RepID=A0ABV2ABU3_9GAMM
MAIAIVLVLLLLGSILFHFLSPWQLTPLASNWGSIDDTIDITLWVTGFVFVAVNLFMAWAIVRYRYRSDRRAEYEPENKTLEWWLMGVTTVGIAALLAPGLFVWGRYVTVPDEAHEVEIVGQQWHWGFRFPGKDGAFGRVDTRLLSGENPFGMDAADPAGLDDVLIHGSRVLLPVDRPVKALLRSRDVLHNFQVVQFRAKMDLVPGQLSYLWLTPTRTGEFEILCAELCGIGHFAMRGMVEVVEPAAFEQWLAAQPTYASILARPEPDAAKGRTLYAPCAACHGTEGQGNAQMNAPRLAGQDAWYLIRQLAYFKSGVRGAHADDTHGQQMRAFASMLVDRAAMADLAAYIETFPVPPPVISVDGNPQRGARVWRNCAACHGNEGQGIQATQAPRLAGIDDWYLQRQLDNFRRGIRGRHPDDAYGWQMTEMAKLVRGEDATRDLIAHINMLALAASRPADGATELAHRSD